MYDLVLEDFFNNSNTISIANAGTGKFCYHKNQHTDFFLSLCYMSFVAISLRKPFLSTQNSQDSPM